MKKKQTASRISAHELRRAAKEKKEIEVFCHGFEEQSSTPLLPIMQALLFTRYGHALWIESTAAIAPASHPMLSVYMAMLLHNERHPGRTGHLTPIPWTDEGLRIAWTDWGSAAGMTRSRLCKTWTRRLCAEDKLMLRTAVCHAAQRQARALMQNHYIEGTDFVTTNAGALFSASGMEKLRAELMEVIDLFDALQQNPVMLHGILQAIRQSSAEATGGSRGTGRTGDSISTSRDI